MTDKYDLNSSADIAELNFILNPYGIHLETNLFDQVYVLIDKHILCKSHGQGGKPPVIRSETIRKAREMRQAGKTVRQIASALSISIGSVSKFTSKSVH